jgi:uncharacterized membrane protein/mono/diheme cytochrome c family protein
MMTMPGITIAGTFFSTSYWLWQFLGRLHPLIVHFPIALLVIALVLEIYSSRRKDQNLRTSQHIILLIGALSALAAAVFGLFLKDQDEYMSDALTIHQWSGIATALLAAGTFYFFHLSGKGRKNHSDTVYRALLICTVIGVAIAGHYGASLTHGSDYLTEVLPWNYEYGISSNPDFNLASFDSDSSDKPLSANQIAALNLEVRSIFAHNCYKCHGAEKAKGQLRLDRKELVMRGGKSGAVIEPGHPETSELIRRLLLPRADKESMPPKGKTLSQKEMATLQLWIKRGAPWPANTNEKSIYRVAALAPRMPALPNVDADYTNPIDRFVHVYFDNKNISWPSLVDDRIYIRRVYLDIIGLLPTPEKVNSFMADTNPSKREVLVKELLDRNEDYAQHWLSFWNDALRNDYTGTGYITGGRFAITGWLFESLRNNKPYDSFVSELISPDKKSEGFIRGIQWRGTVNASQRVEMQAAQNISQVFLGLNLKCASCHDSFISDLKLSDAYAFANIFSDTTLEINRCDKPTGKKAGTRVIFSELGTIDSTLRVEGKLKQLAEYLTAPINGRLYRTIVNRMWAQLMGRGIVEPVDMMDNEPWSQDLLDWLASDFVERKSDLKQLIFLITTSKTYQLPSVGIKNENDILSESYTFKGMHRRRLSAEQFTDAVSSIVNPVYLDTLREYDPYKNSKSSELASYARASLVKNDVFLTALGRPNRENVSTSRSSQGNLLQALELTNGTKFNSVLEAGAKRWKEKYSSTEEMVNGLYQMLLSRSPKKEEMKTALTIAGTKPNEENIQDLMWAILLLPEFQLIY